MEHPVPKVVGIETEYGLAPRSGTASFQLPRDFFESVIPSPISWDYRLESAAQDARSPWISPEIAPESSLPAEKPEPQARRVQTMIFRDLNTVLPNGARFYIDHSHPEWSSPECLTAEEAALYDKAGEMFLMSLVRRFNETRDSGQEVTLYKNNTDHQGHSYGCHENYLMDAGVYQELFNGRSHQLYTYLLPYFITRPIFCGAGKVGGENGSAGVDYQLSQRADFFESVVGLQTTHHRPIINTRDEAHALRGYWRRLHVICGDSNLSAWSTYLKVGVTQLILAMLEDRRVRLPRNITLSDPLPAVRAISQDPTLRVKVRLEGRRARYTALEIQKVYLETARTFLDRDPEAGALWEDVWQDWAQVLRWLEESSEELDRRLDWRIKWKFLQSHLHRKQIGWDDPQARELDLKYHALDEEAGLFFILCRNGLVEDMFDADQIQAAVSDPPVSTRAYVRGLLVQRYSDRISSLNWDAISFSDPDAPGVRTLRLETANPMMYNKQQLVDLLGNLQDLAGTLEILKSLNPG
jgi:proteasome accessory factor A